MNNEVLKFIKDLKKVAPREIEELFSLGYCYWFAVILSQRFSGEICYLPIENHFITRIDGRYYDIKGIYNPKEEVYSWKEWQEIEPSNSRIVIRDCINKEEV